VRLDLAQSRIGLRFQHYQALLDTRPEIAWAEIYTENYMGGDAAESCFAAALV
jgi:uncharacterized protein (UPF0276 family)